MLWTCSPKTPGSRCSPPRTDAVSPTVLAACAPVQRSEARHDRTPQYPDRRFCRQPVSGSAYGTTKGGGDRREHVPLAVRPSGPVIPGHRTSEVFAGLCRALYELTRGQGISWLYAEVEPPFLKAIQQAGFPFEAVTEPKWIYNAANATNPGNDIRMTKFQAGRDPRSRRNRSPHRHRSRRLCCFEPEQAGGV
jgi:hypothetical protein